MDWSWFTTTFSAAGMVVLTAIGIYVSVMICTRLGGLRSFAKLSSFDFAMTVAIGSLIATTIVAETPPLLQSIVALASLYALQILVALLRQRSKLVRHVVENQPIVIMIGHEVIEENLRAARMTESDLRAKLRESNVLDPAEVRAVVMETTGDVSVLHGDADGVPLDPKLLEGVKGSERLAGV